MSVQIIEEAASRLRLGSNGVELILESDKNTIRMAVADAKNRRSHASLTVDGGSMNLTMNDAENEELVLDVKPDSSSTRSPLWRADLRIGGKPFNFQGNTREIWQQISHVLRQHEMPRHPEFAVLHSSIRADESLNNKVMNLLCPASAGCPSEPDSESQQPQPIYMLTPRNFCNAVCAACAAFLVLSPFPDPGDFLTCAACMRCMGRQ